MNTTLTLNKAIQNLSKAIQIKTISNRPGRAPDYQPFDDFIVFLKEAYPICHEHLDAQYDADPVGGLRGWGLSGDRPPAYAVFHGPSAAPGGLLRRGICPGGLCAKGFFKRGL